VLEDLRERLGRTRWPDEIPVSGWQYGANLAFMRRLTERWRDGFDPVITGYGPAPWPRAARQSAHIYEQQGLMVARREANGYRDYDDEPTCGSSARSGPPGAQEPPSELLALTAARALPMPRSAAASMMLVVAWPSQPASSHDCDLDARVGSEPG
jgi:hypothetical protein